ncbi:beta propellor repeat [Fragilaria crotonensis]|nr:beta propellor repeat [Fragilaria crotonensis]
MEKRQPPEFFGNREGDEHQEKQFSDFASLHDANHSDGEEYNETRDASSSILPAGVNTDINASPADELVDKHGQGDPYNEDEESIHISQEEMGDDSMPDVFLVLGVQGTKRRHLPSTEEMNGRSSPHRSHVQDGDDCKQSKAGPPCHLQLLPHSESTQTLLVSPEKSSIATSSETSPDSSLITSPHASVSALMIDDAFDAFDDGGDESTSIDDGGDECISIDDGGDDCTSTDDDSCDEAPLMIALGVPVVSEDAFTHHSSIEKALDDTETIIASREKGIEERDQEAIDQALAGNVAIDQQNEKEGKKTLPEVDKAALIRRHSSRMSGAKSGDHSSSGKSDLAIIDGDQFRYSNSPPQPMAATPVFGTRHQGDLILDEGDEDNADLIAHTGLALQPPGAYFVPGPNATGRQMSDMTDHSVPDQVTCHDEEVGTDSPEIQIANTGIDAVLARSGTFNEGVVVTGEVVNDENDMTEEERKVALRRWTRIQVAVALGVLCLAGVIAAIVVSTRLTQAAASVSQADGWVRMGSPLTGPPGDDNLFFGTSFSLSGSGLRFAVGLPGIDKSITDNDVGQVQIFDFNDGEWVQTSVLNFDARSGKAGEALALSTDGRRLIVGSPFWSNESGRISVFEDMGNGTWQQIGDDIRGKDSEKDGRFGKAVAISKDGRIIAVGAPFAHSDAAVAGVVRVYIEVASEWVQRGFDIAPNANNTLFGSSLAISADGNRIAIGATNSGVEVGRVDVFDFNDTHWTRSGKALVGMNSFESFGSSVALNADGNLLAVGAIGSSGEDGRFNSGKVQAFEFDVDEWIQLGKDILGRGSESLGTSLDLSDDGILAVGGPSGGDAGQVKVYFLDEMNEWRQVENTIEGSTSGETFGFSTSISADGTMVGSGAPNANFDGRVRKVGAVNVYRNTHPEYSATPQEKELT